MPTTSNKKFSIPNTGAEVGIWGSNDINPNFVILDNLFGSVTTLNVAGSGTVTLSDAQQQVAVIRLTGALTGAGWVVTFTEPGYWIIDNQATNINVPVVLGGASGNQVSIPNGSRYTMVFDGSNAFVLWGDAPGTLKKFVTGNPNPAWNNNNTVRPYLPCQGGTFLGATYPALAALLGTTFGGNGATTFGLPDLQGRTEFDLDNGAGRISSATFSPNGNTLGATGGAETSTLSANNVPVLAFAGTAQTWNTNQNLIAFGNGTISGGGGATDYFINSLGVASTTVTPAGTVNAGSPNSAFGNIPPAMVTGITFIKT